MAENILQIRNLKKQYRDGKNVVEALKGIDLDIHRGETFGLLGVNGAGKTTLSSILATLHPPTSGSVQFNGEDIYADLVGYRQAIGFCPQKPNLDLVLTVRENLIFAGGYYLLPDDEVRDRVDRIMDQLNLKKYSDFKVRSLSGGYKQRVLIARAMVHNPQIVLFDEPTVGLDPDIRRSIWDQITQLKEQGVTVILTTHYLDEAEVLCDRVCFLSHGEVVLVDESENLKAKYGKNSLEQVFLHLVKSDE